jgi:uncharacterized protein (TIGR02145 family)
MRKITFIYSLIVTIFLLIFVISCKKEEEKKDNEIIVQVPTLVTTEITYITDYSAVCTGKVTSDGGGSISVRGVCWSSTSQTPTISDNKALNGSCIGSFKCAMTGLQYNTTYYLRAFATNSAGTGYGNVISFKTLDTEIPDITTIPVSNITQTSASCGGNIIYDGSYAITVSGICWSMSNTPTINDYKTIDGNLSGSFVSSLINLATGAKYYVRAYATNCKGTGYGEILTFTTVSGVPTLSTITPYYTTINTFASGGIIISNGGSVIISKGICWSLSPNPTISDNQQIIDLDYSNFSDTVTGLNNTTTYYIRAFATNSFGTGYGAEFTITTLSPASEIVTDIDGNIYHTVTIGTQVWLLENLKTTRYRNGDEIGTTAININVSGETIPKYQWAFNGDENTVNDKGRYYTWYTITDSRGICPDGWHIPSEPEWQILENYLINNGYGTTHPTFVSPAIASTTGWDNYNYQGAVGYNPLSNNTSGLTILPVGFRYTTGYFYYSYWAYVWTGTEFGSNNAKNLFISESSTYMNINDNEKSCGLSVRCVKN